MIILIKLLTIYDIIVFKLSYILSVLSSTTNLKLYEQCAACNG